MGGDQPDLWWHGGADRLLGSERSLEAVVRPDGREGGKDHTRYTRRYLKHNRCEYSFCVTLSLPKEYFENVAF